MKRRDLIKLLKKNGWTFLRDGGRHDIYTNGEKEEPIPRHKEINEILAQKIIKKHGLK
ncbi:MAG: type II toxin-antitoxin system HicA family toxin [Ruminococcus sp.]|nr:type II toxin-antitoxin system HicA family toxin [Ruminococcus sp.]